MVLPQPDGPTTVVIFPGGTSKLTPSSASTSWSLAGKDKPHVRKADRRRRAMRRVRQTVTSHVAVHRFVRCHAVDRCAPSRPRRAVTC